MSNTTKKELGQIKHLNIKLEDNMDFAEPLDIHGPLTILVGQNGSGKTLTMQLIWAMSYATNNFLVARDVGPALTDNPDYDMLMPQFIFDNALENNNFTGKTSLEFKCGTFAKFELNKGEVINFEVIADKDITPQNTPKFMSKDIRTISSINMYLAMRYMVGILGTMTRREDIIKMLTSYKLFDILYIERIVMMLLGGPYEIPNNIKMPLVSFDDKVFPQMEEIILETFNGDKPPVLMYKHDGGKVSPIAQLGAGHQSIINMHILATI